MLERPLCLAAVIGRVLAILRCVSAVYGRVRAVVRGTRASLPLCRLAPSPPALDRGAVVRLGRPVTCLRVQITDVGVVVTAFSLALSGWRRA